MEVYGYMRVRLQGAEQYELVRSLLEVDPDCPLFEEDVDEPMRESFREMEFIAIPDEITPEADKHTMTIHWFVSDHSDVVDAFNGFVRSKVRSIVSIHYDDEDNIFCYAFNGKMSQRVKEWQGKSIDRISSRRNFIKLLESMEKKLT